MSLPNVNASVAPYKTSPGDKLSVSEQRLSIKKYFGLVLFCATVIPFFVALSISFNFSELHTIEHLIQLLALIHVPMTVYLFFDPAIRNQVRSNPTRFIAMPVFLFAVCLLVFIGNTPDIIAQKAGIVTCFMLGVLAWNFWHFGKQNIGVYAYYRLAENQNGMAPVEKKLIYAGAFLGTFSVSFLGLGYYGSYQAMYARNANFDDWIFLSGYISVTGGYIQYALAFLTLAYIIYSHRKFDLKSALMLFLCVNYFLPAYLSLNREQWIAFFIASSYTHGAQYIAFLLFHSYNMKPLQSAVKRSPSIAFLEARMYTIILLLLSVALYFIYNTQFHFADSISEAYWRSLTDALAIGVLLNHFWFDSFFWKFSNKESRNWLLERYNFLFKPAPATND